jgi:drug/metabolite transporter (DMT)-like permease
VSRRRAEAALVGNTIVWGATFTLVKETIRSVSPILFLALRFVVATAVLAVYFHFRGRRTPAKRRAHSWRAGALIGAFLFSGYVLQTQGLRFTTAPRSAFITGLASVMVPLLGALVYKSRPQVSEVVGVLVATAGLGLMTLQGAIGSADAAYALGRATISRGDLLTLAGALAFAAHIVALGHFSERMSFEFLSMMQVGSAAVLALALCGWAEQPYAEWRPTVVCVILITGFLATALAFTIQAWAQQFTTSTRTALIYMLEPVFAWMTSYVLAGENLTGRAAVGAVLILGGVMLVEAKPLYPRPHPSE